MSLSSKLIIAAPVAGPKSYIFRGTTDGIGIDESPQAGLTFNGNNYALYETIIWKKGAHRPFKQEDTYDMEMNLYFRDIFNPSSQIALAIPITIDDSRSAATANYFNELTSQNSGQRNQTLEALINDGPVLTYKGMDLRLRNSAKTIDAPYCSNSEANMTWFVIPTTYISTTNANKIRSIEAPCNKNPPRPTHEITLERMRSMTMMIPKIDIQSKLDISKAAASKAEASKGIYLTRALQCQRIDPTRDVRRDKVYLPDSQAKTTLKDELDMVASLDTPLSEIPTHEAGRRARQVEDILAIVVGIVIGLIVFGFIAYYLMNNVYKDYIKTINTNQAIIVAAESVVKK